MNMAIAYGMKKKARGGMMCAHGSTDCHMCHGGKMAEGGAAEKGVHQAYNGYESKGVSRAGLDYAMSKPSPGEKRDKYESEDLENAKNAHYQKLGELRKLSKQDRTNFAEGGDVEDDDEDMVGRIMSNRYPHDEFESEEDATGYGAMPDEPMKEDEPAMGEDDRMMNQHGEYEEGSQGSSQDNESQREEMYEHAVENQGFPEDEEDLVSRIMRQHQEHYSEGGKVANDSEPMADDEDAQYDDLVKDDDLEEHYTGANSGDELGDQELEDEMHDIISRIMRSRAKKDRNPVPA